jgi:hypothetical protein
MTAAALLADKVLLTALLRHHHSPRVLPTRASLAKAGSLTTAGGKKLSVSGR